MNYRFAVLAILFYSCVLLNGQTGLPHSSFADLRIQISKDTEYITVLNFWATWCRPCVSELPDFEKINTEFKQNKVKVILANIDFNSKADSLVPAFIKKNNIQSQVVHITDQDANDWINSLWYDWTGSIPVTAIYYKGEKIWFFEGITDYETLKSIITKYIQQ